VALSVVRSARRHNLDPRLIASIVIVESRANPFAISSRDSIGIMQVHLPTWGRKADGEGINLFKIEDNVDFGARILKDYVRQSGLWEGVKRYKGWFPDNPQSESSAEEYVAKVQRIYGYQQPVAATADLLQ
jgi:soluble lytic murein transglycosylase-like protein